MMKLTLLLLSILLVSTECCRYKNERFQDGDTWVVRSTFVMRCKITKAGWSTAVIGCRTPNGVVVEPGQKLDEENVVSPTYECRAADDGKVEIRRTYQFDKKKGCEGHAVGETWVSERNFQKECTPKGVRINSCVTDAGIPVKLNDTLTLSGIVYNCNSHPNGTVTIDREVLKESSLTPSFENLRPVDVLGPMFKRFQSLGKILNQTPVSNTINDTTNVSKEIVCNSKGKVYKIEETWVSENRFTKKCTSNGSVLILNCILDNHSTIDVNSETTIDNKLYKCYRNITEGRVYLEIVPQ